MIQKLKSVSKSNLNDIVNQIAYDYMLFPILILGITRVQPYPEARAEIAKELYRRNYSYSAIGRALNRHYTSIMYMVDPDFRKRKKESNIISAIRQSKRNKI